MVLLAEMLPSAINRAMQSLPIRLQTEAETASRSNGQFYPLSSATSVTRISSIYYLIVRALKRRRSVVIDVFILVQCICGGCRSRVSVGWIRNYLSRLTQPNLDAFHDHSN